MTIKNNFLRDFTMSYIDRILHRFKKSNHIIEIMIMIVIAILVLSGCSSHQGNTVSKQTKTTATKIAKKQIGMPYRYGGKTPREGFDCSGLIFYSYAKSGVKIPRTTQNQFNQFLAVKKPALGDILFFGSRNNPNHSGIYIGNNTMLHAPRTGKNVELTRIDSAHWRKKFLGAKAVTTI